MPYSETLKINRDCSDNESFDKRCNDLERWLMERGYNDKMIKKTNMKSLRAFHEKPPSEQKLTFSVTYYPIFQNIRNTLQEFHLLLVPNKEHKNVPVVKFCSGKSPKDYLPN